MFESSRSFLFFDYFRVPYRVTSAAGQRLDQLPARHPLRSCGWLAWARTPSPRSLGWPSFEDAGSGLRSLIPAGSHRLGDTPIHCRVLTDDLCGRWLQETGGSWTPTVPIRDRRGRQVASVWRDQDGSLFLPYDPAEVMGAYWSEGYQTSGQMSGVRTLGVPARRLALAAYYRARSVIPRAGQIWLRRQFSRVQARSRFPRWPVEPALHDFYAMLFQQAATIAGAPVPFLSPWPHGRSWAFVLTHDVETLSGYRNLHVLRDLEVASGYRSSWNFVPGRYTVDQGQVHELVRDGFEVGVHGLYHDGRDLESLAVLHERLPMIRRYADAWQASGFRSPATRRVWAWMPLLGFEYDSSYPDTDPFEPQSGGCCSWLPFFNQDMVELPITLCQDHTVFVILRRPDQRPWDEKVEYLRERGGMALLITHPDYLLDGRLPQAYGSLLRRFKGDESAWRALPREVSAWWRRRAASHLEPTNGGWRVVGPAADEASVTYVGSVA